MAPWRGEPGLSPPESLLDWTQIGETLSGCDTDITRSQRASEDLLEGAEATLVLSQYGWQVGEEGGGGTTLAATLTVSRSELLPGNRDATPKGS